jgi:hypothetical protein
MGGRVSWRRAVLDEPDGWHDESPGAWTAVHDCRGHPPASPLPSRYEPSWYFGDGTLLFNQAATALGQLPDLIVPLDSVLAGPLGAHRGGGSVGVRVSRVLTSRLTAEFSVDYGFATLRITPANGEAIETTRASFIQAWSVILFNRNRVLNGLTSTATLADGRPARCSRLAPSTSI